VRFCSRLALPTEQWLRDQMGAQVFDQTLASFVSTYKFADRPFPNARDLIAALRQSAPQSLQPFITDLLEDRTRWDSEIASASVTSRGSQGQTITVTASAWRENVDELGEIVKTNDFGLARLISREQAACDESAREAVAEALGKSRPDVTLEQCSMAAQADVFQLSLGSKPKRFSLASRRTSELLMLSLGNAEYHLNFNPQNNGRAEPAYLPPASLLPSNPQR
jgi:hypothetical protein